MSFINYTGPIFGKIGRSYIPLLILAEEVNQLQADNDDLRLALKNLIDAVTARMAADEPTDLERLALYTAHKEASAMITP